MKALSNFECTSIILNTAATIATNFTLEQFILIFQNIWLYISWYLKKKIHFDHYISVPECLQWTCPTTPNHPKLSVLSLSPSIVGEIKKNIYMASVWQWNGYFDQSRPKHYCLFQKYNQKSHLPNISKCCVYYASQSDDFSLWFLHLNLVIRLTPFYYN